MLKQAQKHYVCVSFCLGIMSCSPPPPSTNLYKNGDCGQFVTTSVRLPGLLGCRSADLRAPVRSPPGQSHLSSLPTQNRVVQLVVQGPGALWLSLAIFFFTSQAGQ